MSISKRNIGLVRWTPNGTGSGSSAKFTITAALSGKSVTMFFPQCYSVKNGTSTTAIQLNTVLPAWCRPMATVRVPVTIKDKNVISTTMGILEISSTGVVKIYPSNALGAWTDSGAADSGMDAAVVSYVV